MCWCWCWCVDVGVGVGVFVLVWSGCVNGLALGLVLVCGCWWLLFVQRWFRTTLLI